jgi:putative spermidine/putrescine transport system substrate-binding protein
MTRALRVLSWAGAWGRALEEAVSRPFTARTGIDVRHVRHVGLHLPDALTTALEAHLPPPVDVVWCNTAPAIRAAAQGHCAPLDGLAPLSALLPRARPPGTDAWPFVQAYVVHYVFVYRREGHPRGLSSWRDALSSPRHAGRIVLYPGGKGFFPLAQLLGGGSPAGIPHDMSASWAALRELGPRLGGSDYSVGLAEPIRRGEIDLCYRALPNALGFVADGLDVDWAPPEEGVVDTTDALWVPRGVPEVTELAAREYVAFALSAEVQERWCALLGALPVHPAAAAPEVFRARGLPRRADDMRGVLHVPPEIEARFELDWARRFDDAVRAGVQRS